VSPWSRAASALVALVLAIATPAAAQDESIRARRIGVHWVSGAPVVDVSADDLADRSVREKLETGLPQTLVMRVYAYRDGGQPITVAPRSCRVTYDLWEEVYRVQVQEPRVDRVESFRSLEAVLDRCLVARRVAVGADTDFRSLAGERIYFATLIELNPLSPDPVHRLRRWLARPAGGGSVGGSDAFFGSVVSLFVNRRIGSAERTLRFQSQPVRVP
jgi:hypothetical protein